MSRSATAVIVAVIVAVVVVAAGVLVFNNSDLSPVAVRVNGDTVSQQQLNSELKGFANSAYFAQPFAQQQPPVPFKVSDGAVSSLAGAQWLGFRVQNALVEQELGRRGLTLTKKNLAAARKVLSSQGVLAGMSDTASDQLTRSQAAYARLVKAVGGSQAKARAALLKAARHANVNIDERYGGWSKKKLAVCPRAGVCVQSVPVVPSAQQ
jgi:hypothetical protein